MEQQEVGTLRTLPWDPHTKSGVIAKAAGEVAERVDAKYVVAFTQSGDSARRMSRLRGPVPVLAFTPEAQTRSQLALTWGVETFKTASVEHTDEMVAQVDEQLLNIGRVKKGDLVVIIAGSPPGIPGSTNALRVHRMGDAVDGVAPAYRRDRRLGPGLRHTDGVQRVLAPYDASQLSAPGGIRTHTECCLRALTLPLVYRGLSGVRGYRRQCQGPALGKSRVIHYSLLRDLDRQRVALGGGEQRAGGGERPGGRHRVFPRPGRAGRGRAVPERDRTVQSGDHGEGGDDGSLACRP